VACIVGTIPPDANVGQHGVSASRKKRQVVRFALLHGYECSSAALAGTRRVDRADFLDVAAAATHTRGGSRRFRCSQCHFLRTAAVGFAVETVLPSLLVRSVDWLTLPVVGMSSSESPSLPTYCA
jgi:hypothetical protein